MIENYLATGKGLSKNCLRWKMDANRRNFKSPVPDCPWLGMNSGWDICLLQWAPVPVRAASQFSKRKHVCTSSVFLCHEHTQRSNHERPKYNLHRDLQLSNVFGGIPQPCLTVLTQPPSWGWASFGKFCELYNINCFHSTASTLRKKWSV